jgi:hypothetical protein
VVFKHARTGEESWEEWEERRDERDVWWVSRRTGESVWELPVEERLGLRGGVLVAHV